MARPTLTPASTTSAVVLPVTGALSNVSSLPFGVYSDSDSPLFSQYFITGAIDQVAYTYKKLGGDVLDLEITEGQVFLTWRLQAVACMLPMKKPLWNIHILLICTKPKTRFQTRLETRREHSIMMAIYKAAPSRAP